MRSLMSCAVGALLLANMTAAQLPQQGTKLVGSEAVGQAHQGGSVAISADGNTAIVGGGYTYADDADGGAWVFARSGGGWSQQDWLRPSEPPIPNVSVAISGDGNTAILGGMLADLGAGAVWVYTRNEGVWSQEGGALVGTGAVVDGSSGYKVAISADGNTAVFVPAYTNQGPRAWVFTRSGSVWTQQGNAIVGSGGVCSGQCFGWTSVALAADGNTAVVGWEGDDGFSGAAWVFARSNGVWSQQGGKLVGTGAAGPGYKGSSVAISADGNTVVVGGQADDDWNGATWLFMRDGAVWSQQGAKLVATGAIGHARQGASVALSADGATVIVGGFNDDDGAGAAWTFRRDGRVWAQQGDKLVGSGAIGLANQGASIAVSADGSTTIVGGPSDHSERGAAWVFSGAAPATTWVPVVAHNDGTNGSQWRSDLGLLNLGSAAANVQLRFFGTDGVVSNTTYVPAGAQSFLTDVVLQLGANGQGALEVSSDLPLKVTSRTYNQSSAEADCSPNGTHGQGYDALAGGSGLATGQTAYLPGLVEDDDYRTNIGMVNTGDEPATVLIELLDGAGSTLADYTVTLVHGQWAQENRPFAGKARQYAMDRGYAKVTVQSGSGVVAFASVIDNITNDATTITMQR